MVADRSGQTRNEAGGYGKRLRVGLHFTQPNLRGSQSKWHSGQTLNLDGGMSLKFLLEGCAAASRTSNSICSAEEKPWTKPP
jgi:hypothetical protein